MPQANILDGQSIAATQLKKIQEQVDPSYPPHLCVVLAGNHPASQIYVKKKQAAAESIGFTSSTITLDDTVSTEMLLESIRQLNLDPEVHGILVQLPLPKAIDTATILEAISPQKRRGWLSPIPPRTSCARTPGHHAVYSSWYYVFYLRLTNLM